MSLARFSGLHLTDSISIHFKSACSIMSSVCKQLLTGDAGKPSCMQGHHLHQQKPGNCCWPATAIARPRSFFGSGQQRMVRGTHDRQTAAQRSAAQPLPQVVAPPGGAGWAPRPGHTLQRGAGPAVADISS